MTDPICAVLTPAGRGAIATVGVAGGGAVEVVGGLFQAASAKPLVGYGPGSVVLGRFAAVNGQTEELVVGLPRAGYVEVHCHGGTAAVQAICGALVAAGARLVDAATFAAQSESDPLRAAAFVALGDAKTVRTAAILLDQYRGALSAALDRVAEKMAAGDFLDAAAGIQELLDRADIGLHLIRPWRVVLAGAPNAGKSSLMNALMGFERSIVYAEPGTTRDVLSALTAIDGWPVELLDTAGLRETGEALEAAGVERTRRELLRAELVLFVVDSTAAWDEALFQEVLQLAGRAPGERLPLVVVVWNKCDVTRRLMPPARLGVTPGEHPSASVSALTGQGIDELCRVIGQSLVGQTPAAGAAVPFTAEQIGGLNEVLASLRQGEAGRAAAALAAVKGS